MCDVAGTPPAPYVLNTKNPSDSLLRRGERRDFYEERAGKNPV